MKITDRINLWLRIGRSYTLLTSIVPYIFAVLLASKHYHINWHLSILGFIGVVLVHISINMLDDYFDWKKGAVKEYKKLIDEGMLARTHKCFYLEENLTTLNTVLAVALSMDAIGCLIGLYIFTKIGFSVILIAVLAGILGFSYSAPPLRLSYNGFGEITIGLIFGPLLMSGAYITAGANVDKLILFSSVIIGIFVANVAHTHAIMDFDSDIKVGKTSLPTSFKTKNNAIFALEFFYAMAYVITAVGIYLKILPIAGLLTFITIPKAFALVKLMESPDREKKLWMGFIGNWKNFQKEGSDWFMMRLCISRNVFVDFTVILGLTYFIWG